MKYKSVNELNHFDLHDAVIENIEWNGQTLTMKIDGINVSPENSHNPTEKYMCTDKSVFIFEDCRIESIVYHGYNSHTHDGTVEVYDVKNVDENEFNDVFVETVENQNYIQVMKPFVDSSQKVSFDICGNIGMGYRLIISYGKATTLWADYVHEAWFEDEKWKK